MTNYLFYQDANGVQHESYGAACHYYGCDTPADIAREMEFYAAEEREEALDRCNEFDLFIGWPIDPLPPFEMECPF